MAAIEVDPSGLAAFAGQCVEQAARVASTAKPSVNTGLSQPSAAAVQTAYVDVVATGARLAARLESTATTALAGAMTYSTTETTSAAEVAAVA